MGRWPRPRIPVVPWPQAPAIVIEINPDGKLGRTPQGRVEPRGQSSEMPVIRISPKHELARPGPVKEVKKATTRAWFTALNRGIGEATEVLDFVDAMWDAVPEHIQRRERMKTRAYYKNSRSLFKTREPSYRRKLQVIADNWKDLRHAEFLKSFVKNEIEDNVLGRIGRKAGEAGRAMGRPVGVGAGPIF